MAGYSGTPLVKKLGLKVGMKVLLLNAPLDYKKLLGEFPAGVKEAGSKEKDIDFIHLFSVEQKDLSRMLPGLKKQLQPDGMIWVSWYKKSAGKETDITEDVIRAIALPMGLVDIKVCAFDEQWSALKLVIRKSERVKRN